ncbi:MAG: DUF1365 domain-containing protein [Betaproteobacteria bacterium]
MTDFAIIHGEVAHRRARPAQHAFRYPAFCLRMPLARLAELPGRGIALNARGLVAFHERDHGPRDGAPLAPWIDGLLAREGVVAGGAVVLYAFPRMLGYVFNPVSFWVCHDRGGAVKAVLAEVNNTFGERHLYLLAHSDGRALESGETVSARKDFHVSPFCAVRGRYAFRFHFGVDRWLARIDYFDAERAGDDVAESALLETWISGTPAPLDRASLRGLLWRYRWFTLGVIGRIHWQAARLWLKRVPYVSKPAPPAKLLTRN